MDIPLQDLRRLHKRGPNCRGLAVDAEGVALGPDCSLVYRTPLGYRAATRNELAQTLRLTFDSARDAPWLATRLASIAKALQAGELAKAQLLGLYLNFPVLDGEQLQRLARATPLAKDFNPEERRVTAGSGRQSGEWMRDDVEITDASSPSESAQPDASTQDWVSLPTGERIDELGDLLESTRGSAPSYRTIFP